MPGGPCDDRRKSPRDRRRQCRPYCWRASWRGAVARMWQSGYWPIWPSGCLGRRSCRSPGHDSWNGNWRSPAGPTRWLSPLCSGYPVRVHTGPTSRPASFAWNGGSHALARPPAGGGVQARLISPPPMDFQGNGDSPWSPPGSRVSSRCGPSRPTQWNASQASGRRCQGATVSHPNSSGATSRRVSVNCQRWPARSSTVHSRSPYS